MAESKTQRRSPAAKSGSTAAKSAKAPAKGASKQAKDAPKPAKAASKPAKTQSKAPRPAARKAGPKTAKASKGAAASGNASKAGSRPAAKRKVVEQTARRYFEAIAAREPAAIASHWRDDGIYDSIPLGVFRGPDAVRRMYEEMFGAMPDLRLTVERITADDRVAAVQWRSSGTFDGGPFRGIEATGRSVDLRGIDCLEIDDGMIVRDTSIYDGAAAARSMGLLPAEDSGADRAMRAGINTVTKLRRAVTGLAEGSR